MDISNVIQSLSTANKTGSESTLKIELEKSYSARLSSLNSKQPSLSITSGQQQVTLPIPHESASKLSAGAQYQVSFSMNKGNQLVANLFKAATITQQGAFSSQLSQLQSQPSNSVTKVPLNSQATFALIKALIPNAASSKRNQFQTNASIQKQGAQISLGGQQGISLSVPSAIKPLLTSANPVVANITENKGKISAQVPVSKQGDKGPLHSITIPKQQAEQWLQKLASSSKTPITASQSDGQQLKLSVNGKSISVQSNANSTLAQATLGKVKVDGGQLIVTSSSNSENVSQGSRPVLSILLGDSASNSQNRNATAQSTPSNSAGKIADSSAMQKLTSAVKQIFAKEAIEATPEPSSLDKKQIAAIASTLAQKIQTQSSTTQLPLANLVKQITQQPLTTDTTASQKHSTTQQVITSTSQPVSQLSKAILQQLTAAQAPASLKADHLKGEHKELSIETSVDTQTDNANAKQKPINSSVTTASVQHKANTDDLSNAVKQKLVEAMLTDEALSPEQIKEAISQQLNHTLQPSPANNTTFASTVALALQALLGKRLQVAKSSADKSTSGQQKTGDKESESIRQQSASDGKPSTSLVKPSLTNKEMFSQLQKLMEQLDGGEEKLQKSLLGVHQTLRGQQAQNLDRAADQLLHLQLSLPLQKDNETSEVHIDIKEEHEESEGLIKKIWQVNLTFNLPKLGKLLATAKLNQSDVDIKLYSEQSDALKKAKKYTDLLKDRLVTQGLSVSAIHCSLGKIPERTQKSSVNILQIKV